MKPLKVVYVSAGVLKNANDQILLVQRPVDKPMAGLWEFPGGKIEDKESPELALQRELKEELGITLDLNDLKPLCFTSYSYPDFQLVMLVYNCSRWQGNIDLRENQQAFAWVSCQDLKTYSVPPADLPIIEILCS